MAPYGARTVLVFVSDAYAMTAGRPSKFTPEIVARIIQAVREGCFLKVAAETAGVGRRTVNSWLERGEKRTGIADKPYREFRQAYMEALAHARAEKEKFVSAASSKDVKAAFEWLEKRYPEDWSSHRNQLKRIEKLAAELVAAQRRGGGGE